MSEYQPTLTCPPNTVQYTIKAGDTLYAIARQYGTTVAAIEAANPGIDPRSLQVGRIICVPRQLVCPPNTVQYTIKAGDTLYSIARRYGTSVAAIEAANPGIEATALQIGQLICVPRQPVYPVCPSGEYYVVQRGDTMYDIARRYGTSLGELTAANPQVDPNVLAIGQVLCLPVIPTTVRCPPNSFHYRVVPGDTMYGIARRYGVDLNALLTLNSGVNPDALVPGQIICIPG